MVQRDNANNIIDRNLLGKTYLSKEFRDQIPYCSGGEVSCIYSIRFRSYELNTNFQHYTIWILGKVGNSKTEVARVIFLVHNTLSRYNLAFCEVS